MHLKFIKKALLEIMPLISESFNIFLEIPLKIISRNYRYKIIPINWMGRKKGRIKIQNQRIGIKIFVYFNLLFY